MPLLYEDEKAPNPRRVRIFLAEKGIDVPRRNLQILAGEHKAADMRRLNPFERLPFLVLDDGRVIAESIAICRYFEALKPHPSLFGQNPVEQGIVEMWQRRIEFNLLQPVFFAFRHSHARMAALEVPQVKEWAAANLPKIGEMLTFLEGELAGRRYIAGEAYSVADITALCAVDFMRVLRLSPAEEQRHLKRWHAEVTARPSAAA
jgi:glutathione S-transferase